MCLQYAECGAHDNANLRVNNSAKVVSDAAVPDFARYSNSQSTNKDLSDLI